MISETRPEGWWTSAVVYQIYPRSFADSNGDGVGDLPGITTRLDYLARLGVDVLWLSPVYASPMDDNGYDICDYEDVDPLFGSLADLDALIAGAHERGMKLVMDLVVNHTSDEHPWFVESRDPASPKRDWYWWRPPREGYAGGADGAEPTNWESAFSGPAWSFDEASGEYYLHLFSPKQPDLNWENPEVRVRGVRDDAPLGRARASTASGWTSSTSSPRTRRCPTAPPGRAAASPPPSGPPPTDPGCTSSWPEMNREVGLDEQRLLTVGEMPGSTVELARDVTDPARRELTMVFTFEHVALDVVAGGTKWDLADLPLPVLKGNLDDLAARAGRDGVELALLGQPRPAAGGVPLR